MPDQQALHTLLDLNVAKDSPVFIIYTGRITARLQYTCEFIFNHVLHVNFSITDNFYAWQRSEGCKINYSDKAAAALQIIPSGLLFETGISGKRPEPSPDEHSVHFYRTKAGGAETFPFDIFSATFYFISRYEEWQPYAADSHGRFEAKESILYRNNLHLLPLLDQWALELKTVLKSRYPDLIFPVIAFKAISTIDVDNLYAYRSKNFLRSTGASVKDLLKFNFKNLGERIRVLSGLKKDPFDVYDDVSAFCREEQIPILFFFLFKSGTLYDRTVNPDSPAFKHVFSVLKKNHANIGLHPSYDSAFKKDLLRQEVAGFSNRLGEPVTCSRQHFLRFDIRTTPGLLMQQGITTDFTMGFASSPGFRAGTSRPFYYYDFQAEEKKNLLFVPFCAMDGAYTVYNLTHPDKAFQSLWELALNVKKAHGLFITVFHERTFSDHLYPGYGNLYKNLHLKLKELSRLKN